MHPYSKERAAPRIRPRFPLQADCPDKSDVLDISMAGAFIRNQQPPTPGSHLQVRIWLGRIEPIIVNAIVRRVQNGSCSGMGVQFLSMAKTDSVELRQFLAPQLPQA